MRVLLFHDSPLDAGVPGVQARVLLQTLLAAQHSVRALVADTHDPGDDSSVHRVTFGNASADLPFELPHLESSDQAGTRFQQLSDEQIAAYRSTFRKHLDEEVEKFDPHIIHVQHLWLQAELALETGVPYVVSAYPEDFTAHDADHRLRALADQAAENAGRIFIADANLRRVILDRYPDIARYRICPFSAADFQADPVSLVSVYKHVLIERLGRLPDDTVTIED